MPALELTAPALFLGAGGHILQAGRERLAGPVLGRAAGSRQGQFRLCSRSRLGCQRGEAIGSGGRGSSAAQRHTPFHAPWAVAGPHGYQLSVVGGTRNKEGSAPPRAQELGATHLWNALGEGWSAPCSLDAAPPQSRALSA